MTLPDERFSVHPDILDNADHLLTAIAFINFGIDLMPPLARAKTPG